MNLREQAEKRAKQQIVEFRKQQGQDSTELVHELRVHQIELEIQNEELRNTQLELAESRNKYCELYDFAPVGYFTMNKEGLIVGANLTGAAFLGEERSNLLKNKLSHFIAPDSQDEFYLHRKQVVESGAMQSCEVKLRRKDGTEFFAQLVSVAVTGQKDEYDQFHMTLTDITERKQTEEELLWKTAFLESQVEANLDGVLVVDSNNQKILTNKRLIEMWKVPQHIAEDKNDTSLLQYVVSQTKYPEQFLEKVKYLYAHKDETSRDEIEFKNGMVFDRYSSPVIDKSGKYFGRIWTFRDITDRKWAEHKLLEYQKHLKQLAARLTLAEERERRRIACEIHDEISQTLAMVNIRLDILRNSLPSEASAAEIAKISSSVENVIQETRTLTFELSNPILYELGLETAVSEWLNEQVQEKHGIAAEFQDDGNAKPLDDDVRVLLFRNTRELLINCIKHANAGRVRVGIRRTDGSIEVVVEDNGVGFDTAEIRPTAGKRAKFGLFSVRESLENLGGYFKIESKPGAGCKAVMTAPLKDQSHKKEV
jgi:PAS domain S-box-containing protein